MPNDFILFDMDGVLLEPIGYKIALQRSVKRIGSALGAPNAQITENQIALFETANVTNEWDTIAICAAMILVHVWQCDPTIRLNNVLSKPSPVTQETPNFEQFLMTLEDRGPLPGLTAYDMICDQSPWLSDSQRMHLKTILENCRDIFSSPILPAHQETILGSKIYHSHYGLLPQLDTESFLLSYDRPLLKQNHLIGLLGWLSSPCHFAGIMTNRPNMTHYGEISPPEAELGVKSIGLEFLPIVGSGILACFAKNYLNFPDYTLAKPNPVHALALIQLCLGREPIDALHISAALWQGKGNLSDWEVLDGGRIVIFEDSVKGFISGQESARLLSALGLNVYLKLIGVSKNPIKIHALQQKTTHTIENINNIHWDSIFS